MSFLLDPPLLVASGAAIENVTDDPEVAAKLEKVTLGVYLGVSGLLWLNAPGTRPIANILGSESGRDFMLNSGWFSLGLLGFEHENSTAKTHATALGIFATYPVWLKVGRAIGKRIRARRSGVAGAGAGQVASNSDVEMPLATTSAPEKTEIETAATPA